MWVNLSETVGDGVGVKIDGALLLICRVFKNS
jgi:hypothetical protein